VYFCDPAYQPHAAELSEEFIGRLKQVVNDLDLPWDYAPLHDHLRRLGFAAVADPRVVP
jgi:hypothetical protein